MARILFRSVKSKIFPLLLFLTPCFLFSQNVESFVMNPALSIGAGTTQTNVKNFSSSHTSINSSWGLYRVRINITTGNGSYGDKEKISVRLTSPDGNFINLVNTSSTLSKRNYLDTWFRDDAPMSIANMLSTTGTYYFNTPGSWKADGGSLNSKFNNGQNPNGNWTLSITTGTLNTNITLNSWEVEFRDTPAGDRTTSIWVTNSESGYPSYNDCATPVKIDKYHNYYGRTRLTYTCNTSTDPPISNPGPWYTTSYTNTTLDNTIWYSFMTDAIGGSVDVLFSYITRTGTNGYQATVVDPGSGACIAANWTRVTGNAFWGNTVTAIAGATLGTNIYYNSVIKCSGLAANKIYYICVDGNGNSAGTNCGGGTPSADVEFQIEATGAVRTDYSSLPIELISFNAACDDNKINLNWSTYSETNNDYFTIEKSSDLETWEVIANVDGAGNSNDILNYEYTDNEASNGDIYYRLKQTDYDGNYEYFAPEVVNCSNDAGGMEEITIYPNPAENICYVDFINLKGDMISLSISNCLGQTVYSCIYSPETELYASSINIEYLPSGIYFISANSDNNSLKNLRLIKQ